MNSTCNVVFLMILMLGSTRHAQAQSHQPPPSKPQTQSVAKPQANAKAQSMTEQEAAADAAYYAYIPWRSNDPFVFCKYGPPPSHCWKPINPILGTWAPTCPPPKKPNLTSIAYYMRVCPQAEDVGEWEPDNDGTPTSTPFEH